MERLPALPQKELPGLKTVAHAATIGPVPWPAGDIGEDEKEVLMFRLRGSSRCRQMGGTATT